MLSPKKIAVLLSFALAVCGSVAAQSRLAAGCTGVAGCLEILAIPASAPAEVSRAIELLSKRSDEVAVQSVLNLLDDRSQRVRMRAAKLLPDLRLERRHLPWLIAAARQGAPDLDNAILKLAGNDAPALLRDLLLSNRKVDAAGVARAWARRQPEEALTLALSLVDCSISCAHLDRELIAVTALTAAATKELQRERVATTLIRMMTDPSMRSSDRAFAAQVYAQYALREDLTRDRTEILNILQTQSFDIGLPLAHLLARHADAAALPRLLDALSSDPATVLPSLASLGSDARPAAPRVAQFITADNPHALAALRAVEAMDEAFACTLGNFVAEHADPAVLAEFLSFAAQSAAAGCSAWMDSPPVFWHPGLAALPDLLRVEPRDTVSAAGTPEPAGSSRLHVLPPLCAVAPSPEEPALRNRTVRYNAAQLRDAADADIEPVAALQTSIGWFAASRRGQRLIHVGAAGTVAVPDDFIATVTHVFTFRDAVYAIADSDPINQVAAPLLLRLQPDGNALSLDAVIHLPAQANTVYGDAEDSLIIATRGGGYIDLTNPSRPAWLGCAYAMEPAAVPADNR